MTDEFVIEVLLKTVEFYADKDVWGETDDCSGGLNWSALWVYEFDKEKPWDIAAKALKEIEE